MALRQRGEESRSRLFEAALECFARHGYEATGVAEICQRAGLSKGAFYHHFPSKQALFLSLLKGWLGMLDMQLAEARSEAATVPQELSRMAALARQVFQDASGQLPMFLEFWTQAAHDPEIWRETIAPYRRYRDLFAEMIQRGIAQGSLRPVDPQIAAQVVVSLAIGMLLQGLLDPQGADWGRAIQEGIQILLQGIERRPG